MGKCCKNYNNNCYGYSNYNNCYRYNNCCGYNNYSNYNNCGFGNCGFGNSWLLIPFLFFCF
ncbi:MAG: hypothetical protein IIV48_06080 [Clostridium sp.]|nr:hypothetical protein [Clostridium sp.]